MPPYLLLILLQLFPLLCAVDVLYGDIGETGVSRDTFHFFSNIAENMYDRDLELTRQGRGILPLQTRSLKLCYHLFVATEYGVNDTWSNCPNLPCDGVG